ncbi:hypothetical protein D3C72_1428480 [compost metagenome]
MMAISTICRSAMESSAIVSSQSMPWPGKISSSVCRIMVSARPRQFRPLMVACMMRTFSLIVRLGQSDNS